MEFVSRILDGSISYDLKDLVRRSGSSEFRLAQDEKVRHLQKVPLLEECSQRQLRAVAGISKVVEAPAGAVLTRAGEPGDEFFVLVDGSATVETRTGARRRLGPGAFFGEMSLLDGGPRSATVRAETDVRLIVILSRHFHELLGEVPQLTQKILATLTKRVRQLEEAKR